MIVTRALLATLLLVLTACQQSPEQARQQLADMDIQFDQESFIDSIRNGDAVVVKLFLASGMDSNMEHHFGWIPCPECPLRQEGSYWRGPPGVDCFPGVTDPFAVDSVIPECELTPRMVRPDKPHGGTILHLAAKGIHAPVVEALLDDGANPNAECSEGNRPIDYADEQTEVYELLR